MQFRLEEGQLNITYNDVAEIWVNLLNQKVTMIWIMKQINYLLFQNLCQPSFAQKFIVAKIHDFESNDIEIW